MIDKPYKHWGLPSHWGDMEQLDWEPQLGSAAYPEENLETDGNHENAEPGVHNKLLGNQTDLLVTVFVLTHSGAHSFLQIFGHELGDPRQDFCYSI